MLPAITSLETKQVISVGEPVTILLLARNEILAQDLLRLSHIADKLRVYRRNWFYLPKTWANGARLL